MKKSTVLISLAALSGCSGGHDLVRNSSDALKGTAIFHIAWPEKTRVIPIASNSIRIKIIDPETKKILKNIVVQRFSNKSDSVEISGLPIKKLEDIVTAHYDRGYGAPQAEGRAVIDMKADEPTNVSITLINSIDHLDRIPAVDFSLAPKETRELFFTARNTTNDQIIVLYENMSWTSSDSSVVSVRPENPGGGYTPEFNELTPISAIVTAQKIGVATVTAKEPESGKTISWTVTVGNASEIITIK